MIILSVSLFWVYIKYTQKRIRAISETKLKEELQIPKLEEELRKLPKLEIPKFEIPKFEMPKENENQKN